MPPAHLRPARPEDHPHFVALFAELGVEDPVPSAEQWVRDSLSQCHFLVEGDAVVGYACLRVFGATAHVVHVVTHPRHRQRGLGRALMSGLARLAREAGATDWYLNVKAENAPALALYARFGLVRHHESWVLRFPWEGRQDLPDAPPTVRAAEVPAELDERLEVLHALPGGAIAGLRRAPGSVLYRLVDDARPGELGLGFARFTPSFPGAMPFRVAPRLARPLLEAMWAHPDRRHPHVQLVVDADVTLLAQLEAVGATRKMHLLQLRGRVP